MYDWEIEKYLSERNHLLEPNEIMMIQDLKINPQINHIIYKNCVFKMWSYTGQEFWFESKLEKELSLKK